MKKKIALISGIVIVSAMVIFIAVFRIDIFGKEENINMNTYGKVNPCSWTAVDGLGRVLPDYAETGDVRNDKFVGLFYWTWHYVHLQNRPARNVTQLLQKSPEAIRDYDHPLWQDEGGGIPHYWNEPLFGYYSNLDEYVVRKHAELIADAGVDVIVFDCTNGTFIWEDGYETLFRVFSQAIQEGVNVPQIAFMLPFSADENTKISLHNLYNNIYLKGRYEELWFMWDGKPLIMAHKDALSKQNDTDREILDFFTFRANEPTYFAEDTKLSEEIWGWCSVYPQTKFGTALSGTVEQMCVSVAQNAADGRLVAMNADADVQGRKYTEGDYSYSFRKGEETVTVDKNTENAIFYGLNFQQQWDYAMQCDPEFIFVTGWNEWLAGRFEEWCGTENAFPDQFNDEFSRDIEPSAGILKDYYYYQLVANIRKFKGMTPPDTKENTNVSIDINGEDSQWDKVYEYHHYENSTRARSSDTWTGIHYESDTMRNDFVSVKVAYDKENVYFRIKTREAISPFTDNAWMRLLLDTDSSDTSSWEGFEYIINRENAQEDKVTVEKSTGGWSFTAEGFAKYRINDNIMYLEIPRSLIGLENDEQVHFNFKLSDNMQTDSDILDFYKSGDVAPGGRFAFTF